MLIATNPTTTSTFIEPTTSCTTHNLAAFFLGEDCAAVFLGNDFATGFTLEGFLDNILVTEGKRWSLVTICHVFPLMP